MWDACEIEAALRRSRIGLRLESRMEAEYDKRRERAARRQIVLVLAGVAVLAVLGFGSDLKAGILADALILKLGLQFPALLLGLLAAWRLPMPAGRLWLAGAVPFAVSVVVVITMAIQTAPPFTDRFATIAGLTVFGANIALPIKFREALPLTVTNVVLFVAIPLASEPFSRVEPYLDILVFMSLIALSTLVVVHNRERADKRSFLLALTAERQTTELQGLVNELTQLAHRDALTGAGNRRSFDMRFDAAWRAATLRREPVEVILVDVDHFKLFNDAAGHAEGDRCLRAVAEAIARGAGCPIEMVGRYGGEEFALVPEGVSSLSGENIRASVAALAMPHPGLPAGGTVTVSVGKAFANPARGQQTPDALLRAADAALYEAKRNGRNRVVVSGHVRKAAA